MNWKGAKWNGLRVSRSYQVIFSTHAEWFIKAALALLVHLSSWSSGDRLISDTRWASAFDSYGCIAIASKCWWIVYSLTPQEFSL